MREHALTPSRFLRGLVAALAAQNVTRLTPAGRDGAGFAAIHRYLQGALAHDADVGDETFSRSELEAVAAGLAPGEALDAALRAEVPDLLREDPRGGYRIGLDEVAATTLISGYETHEMGFIAVAAHVFLRDSAIAD